MQFFLLGLGMYAETLLSQRQFLLTHWSLGDVAAIWMHSFQIHYIDWYQYQYWVRYWLRAVRQLALIAWPNTVLYCYNGINFLQNIQERYSASVPAMMSAILFYIRPCYNGTQLHWPYTLISHWVDWGQWNKCIHYLEKNPFSILKLKMCCHLPFIQKWYLRHNFYQYLLQSYALVDNNVSKWHVNTQISLSKRPLAYTQFAFV